MLLVNITGIKWQSERSGTAYQANISCFSTAISDLLQKYFFCLSKKQSIIMREITYFHIIYFLFIALSSKKKKVNHYILKAFLCNSLMKKITYSLMSVLNKDLTKMLLPIAVV